jgi:uncharacterized tellurite resistance protein B-like protein
MGFLDRLRAEAPAESETVAEIPHSLEFTVTIGEETLRFSLPVDPNDDYYLEENKGPTVSAADCWKPLGEKIEVQGRQIAGGVYVGSGLRGFDSKYIAEPSLIDPALKAETLVGDEPPQQFYWPSYEALDKAHRGGYLDWLAGPRSANDAHNTYLFIYFAGIERRLLADPREDPASDAEQHALAAELARLASECEFDSGKAAFLTHCQRLLSFLEARELLKEAGRVEPPTETSGWEVPPVLRLMIGELATAGQPLPTELALSWILTSPEAYLRTPAQRCPAEFRALFTRRYAEQFGQGIELPSDGEPLRLSYSPSSQGLHQVFQKTDLPDLGSAPGLVEPLRELGRSCCSELDPYSRWLGRNPDQHGSFKGIALLPAPLIATAASPELDSVRSMVERVTSTEQPWFFDQGELIELWSPGAEKLPKKEAVMANQMVEALGYAIEPDQRFGGPSPRPGTPAVLFEALEGDPRSPSPAYASASLLLHLMSAVAAADGTINAEEEELLKSHIHGVEELYPGERSRLKAHAMWLTRAKPKFNGMRKKLEQLDGAQRQDLAQSLVALAAADGEIDPEEVKILGKIFDLLGLDPKSVYSALHGASAEPGSELPDLTGADPQDEGKGDRPEPRGLDREAIDRKVEETALVSTMLAGIFEDPDEAGDATGESDTNTPDSSSRDSELLARLCEQENWSRSEIEALGAELELMIDGAIEKLNDDAFEKCGEPLVEGDDPIYIDAEVGKELMA